MASLKYYVILSPRPDVDKGMILCTIVRMDMNMQVHVQIQLYICHVHADLYSSPSGRERSM